MLVQIVITTTAMLPVMLFISLYMNCQQSNTMELEILQVLLSWPSQLFEYPWSDPNVKQHVSSELSHSVKFNQSSRFRSHTSRNILQGITMLISRLLALTNVYEFMMSIDQSLTVILLMIGKVASEISAISGLITSLQWINGGHIVNVAGTSKLLSWQFSNFESTSTPFHKFLRLQT